MQQKLVFFRRQNAKRLGVAERKCRHFPLTKARLTEDPCRISRCVGGFDNLPTGLGFGAA